MQLKYKLKLLQVVPPLLYQIKYNKSNKACFQKKPAPLECTKISHLATR